MILEISTLMVILMLDMRYPQLPVDHKRYVIHGLLDDTLMPIRRCIVGTYSPILRSP